MAMDRALARAVLAHRHQLQEYGSLKFKKSGLQISTALAGLIEEHNLFIGDAKKVIDEICKRREIDPNEVYGSITPNEENLGMVDINDSARREFAYETKAHSNLGGNEAKSSAIQALQKDLNKIRELLSGIVVSKEEMASMERIRRHIEQDRTFDLTHKELVAFGF